VSIRFKVVIPYLILTLVVAAIGVYVVTQLISGSQEERLKNQLRQAGRVVSDEFVTQEKQHVEKARQVAFTDNVVESLQAGDRAALERLVRPQVEVSRLEQVLVIDEQRQEQLHLLRRPDGVLENINYAMGMGESAWIRSFFLVGTDAPGRVLGQNQINQRYYYYTALPILRDKKVLGIVVIGTSLDVLLPRLKSISLADVILYDGTGKIIASTLAGQTEDTAPESTFSLDQASLNEILAASNIVYGEHKKVLSHNYSIARGVFKVGRDRLGVFGVVLPVDFIVDASSTRRSTVFLIFAIAALVVVLLGYRISHMLISPLQTLLRASQAIAGGDLNQRTGIRTSDEIGELANTFDEMTERLQERTNELEKTYKVLEQMDRTKVSFIEVAAHELRTPLTLVKGYTQMLAMKFKNEPEMMALTQGILDGSDRMQEIVGSMLDVSRIDSKLLKILPEDTNLGVVMARVYKNFRDALQERNLSFAMQGVDGLPIIQADPDQLYKVFYHLVINAIKYTPDGGRITVHGHLVEVGDGQNEVEIVVSDTGIGIDSAHHELIFEKFYQTGEVYMHSSGKTKFKGGGPGLGLAIARGVVEAHEGRIWVESPGHDETRLPGSQFFVRLPLKVKDNEHPPILEA